MFRRLLALASLAALAGGAAWAAPAPPAPYHDPPFAAKCHFRHFGEGVAPPPTGYPDDPLCVEYAKRDITVDNGGAVAVRAAEPARFAIAARACRYWQVDHWSVQIDRGFTAIVRWDGSYWFDRGKGIGGVSDAQLPRRRPTERRAQAAAAWSRRSARRWRPHS